MITDCDSGTIRPTIARFGSVEEAPKTEDQMAGVPMRDGGDGALAAVFISAAADIRRRKPTRVVQMDEGRRCPEFCHSAVSTSWSWS